MITIKNKEVQEEIKRLMADQIMGDSCSVDVVGGRVRVYQQIDAFDYRLDNTELKEELIGKYYLSWPTEAGRWMKIINCYGIRMPERIADGLALCLEDGYWRFGCSKEWIKTEEELKDCEYAN